jgi:aminocarboxymuconate-semialdehyde decarboxylase
VAEALDVHAHFYPSAFVDCLHTGQHDATVENTTRGVVISAGGMRAGPLGPEYLELEPRLRAMDAQGVATQALSLTMPMVYWAEPDFGERLARTFNDAVSEACQAHPDRFVGLVTLPMQDPARALAELHRIAGLPGIKGVYSGTNIAGRQISEPDYLPVYEAMAGLGLPLFLHPISVIGAERLGAYHLANLLGNPFDTAVAAAYLIFAGVLDQIPALQVCLPHAGGALPWLVGRMDQGWRVRHECRHLSAPPSSYLDRFHYDTISHAPEALRYLIDLVGIERIVLGSDYCFDMGYEQPVAFVEALDWLSAAERAAILSGNARRLLRM